MRHTPLAIPLVPALVLAGCVGSAADLDAASLDAADATATIVDRDLSWDGSIPLGATVCPIVTCEQLTLGAAYEPILLDGTLRALSLTMTWEATRPNTEELRFGLNWGGDRYGSVEGPSPLVLELRGLSIAAEDEPYLWAYVPTAVPQGLATALTPQDFRVEGTLSEEVAAIVPQGNATRTVEIVEEGSVGVMAFGCAVLTCLGQNVVQGERFFEQPLHGAVEGELSVEWDAVSPATADLLVGVLACRDPCNSDADVSDSAYVSGPSPLSLDVRGFHVPEGETLLVYVQQPGRSVAGAFVLATAPQDFTLRGTLSGQV